MPSVPRPSPANEQAATAGEPDGYGREAEGALDEVQRTLDLLTDTLLSHLAHEERALLHPLARHGLG